MKKEEIYLDMSKLTKEQQDEIIRMLPENEEENQYDITENYYFLSYHTNTINWWIWSYYCTENKTEITYEKFKDLYPVWYNLKLNNMNYKNYRFLTWEEMEGRFEKDERGRFWCVDIAFASDMYHLLGKSINERDAEFILNNEDKIYYNLTSDINGDLRRIFTPEMITNEPLPTSNQYNLEQSIKQLKEVAERLNLKVSITFE